MPYAEIRDLAGRLLSTDDVMPGVMEMIPLICIEAGFAEGTKLIAIFDPIRPGEDTAPLAPEDAIIPGEIITPDEDQNLFEGADVVELEAVNTGDRDIQVRSHAHFFETNRALHFDRAAAWGRKLDVPAGAGVRFEPGIPKLVRLVPIQGLRVVVGQAGLVNGALDAPGARDAALARAQSERISRSIVMVAISRRAYAELYGPTKGDLVRLGDTSLLAEIEHDYTVPGHELVVGAGKTLRDSEGINARMRYSDKALDIVIQNATIIDAELGIVKADIGIRDGRIVGIGKAGNPDVMPSVHPDLIVGHTTTGISGAAFIVTAGAIECHAHIQSPEQSEHALAGGTTTLIGGSPGPVFEVGSGSTTTFARFLQGTEHSPLNFALFGKGGSDPAAVEESVAAGAMAVKVHEDFGASPAVIDGSLIAADRNDFAVHLHTNSINEFGYCEDTLAAIGDRTIHMYHVEGAGGGHAPDLLKVNAFDNVIPSSTNPTNPFTAYGLEEGVPMTMICHQLNYNAPEDVAFAEARIRAQSMVAEDFLHDMGAISIFGTDTQGMGRLAENVAKCWQLASVMKDRSRPVAGRDNGPRRQRADQALRRQTDDQPGDRSRHRRSRRVDCPRQAGRPCALAARIIRYQAMDGHQERLCGVVRDGRRQWQHAVV